MHRLWREEGPRLPTLTCDDGTLLRVVYPGRPSAAAGPDFRDAILSTQDGRLLRGDVELHLTPGGWRAHGHHRDRLYNGVVLNVVLWPASSGRGQTRLEMGARVPTVALFPVLDRRQLEQGSLGLAPALPLLPGAPDRVAVLLDRAGDARFRKKVRLFAGLLSARRPSGPPSPGQVRPAGAEELLYQRLMEALGYTRNREPFLALAQGVPLALLARAVMGASGEERARTLLALLLGGGGFLADTPTDASLRESWRSTGLAPVVSRGGWRLFRVRAGQPPQAPSGGNGRPAGPELGPGPPAGPGSACPGGDRGPGPRRPHRRRRGAARDNPGTRRLGGQRTSARDAPARWLSTSSFPSAPPGPPSPATPLSAAPPLPSTAPGQPCPTTR